jgi:hypothetical protein
MHDNYHKLNAEAREEEEMEKIKKELHELKEKEKSWEAEREEIMDLFNDGALNKNKDQGNYG